MSRRTIVLESRTTHAKAWYEVARFHLPEPLPETFRIPGPSPCESLVTDETELPTPISEPLEFLRWRNERGEAMNRIGDDGHPEAIYREVVK